MGWDKIDPAKVVRTLEDIRLRQIVSGIVEVFILVALVLIILIK